MAAVEIRFESPFGVGSPLHAVNPDSVQIMTSSASSQASTAAATKTGCTVSITASGGAIKFCVAAAPDTATGTLSLVPDGSTRSFGGVAIGHKVAIVDA